MTAVEVRHLVATRVFQLEDAFARDRGVRGPRARVEGPLRMHAVFG